MTDTVRPCDETVTISEADLPWWLITLGVLDVIWPVLVALAALVIWMVTL